MLAQMAEQSFDKLVFWNLLRQHTKTPGDAGA